MAAVHAGRSLEISNLVDIRSEVNRELAMRLVTDVASGNRFYTDLNGFQVGSDLRVCSLAVTFDRSLPAHADAAASDPPEAAPAGQPLPHGVRGLPAGRRLSFDSAVGSESGRRLAQARWVSDASASADARPRVSGFSNACAGELEVMLDRRLQQDDNRGLGQGVTDNKLTASLYRLLLEERRGGAPVRRRTVA